MKVCILTSSFPRFAGDYAGCFIYDLARELVRRGFSITVIAPSDAQAKRYEHKEGMDITRFNYFFKAGLQKLTYNLGMPDNFRKSLLAKFQVPAFILFFICRSFPQVLKSDVIWSHWIIPSGLLGAVFNKLTGKRHIMTAHSAGLPVLRNPLLKNLIFKFILNNTDRIVAVSSSVKEELLKSLPLHLRERIEAKLRVIPMGIETRLYRGRIDKYVLRKKYNIDAEYVILFLGRLVEIKGIPYLIRAARDLKNYTLIIAGKGDQKELLVDLAKRLAVNVRWPGIISGRKKIDYLSLCDLVIVPSIVSSSGQKEGLPVVILEALACAKPVLASKSGGIQDAIEDGYNGFWLKEKDPSEIAERINNLLGNCEELERMSKNAFNSARRFDLNIIGKKYERIIQQL